VAFAKRPATAVVVAAMAAVVLGAALVGSASGRRTIHYATTPASSGAVNPSAIPLGDGYRSSSPRVGYVDSCIKSFPAIGGAERVGPWINTKDHTWNSETKLAVEGSVSWPDASYSVTLDASTRVIKTNDLPDHPTGVFPISSSDPAYEYDQNPNRIEAQSIDWSLPADPAAAAQPSCTGGGAIGVLSDGVVLFNALDGEGRDAGAHEILDRWQGHPDMSDTYHHHEVPAFMIAAAKSRSTLVGYAIDGYGIYVERNAKGQLLTNSDLDRCHGRTSKVMWNGKLTRIYHYDATLEYPYTVGCFHGTPIATGVGMNMGAAQR
jgi:hypothetical protein